MNKGIPQNSRGIWVGSLFSAENNTNSETGQDRTTVYYWWLIGSCIRKVMYFGVNGKATRGYMIPYNNVGLILRCRRGSVRKPWKSMFSITPLAFDAPLQGTLANTRTKIMLPETRVIGLHRRRWKHLQSNFRGWLRKTHMFWNRVRIVALHQ